MDININLLDSSLKEIFKASKDIRKFVNDLVDKETFVEIGAFLSEKSVLEDNSALSEGVLTGYASIEDTPVYIIAQNSAVLSGSFGIAQAQKIMRCIDYAVTNGHAILSILDSSGARVGEGINCLESFAMVLSKVAEASIYVPHFAIAKGNAVGHFAAYLSMTDFVFGGADAVASFNPPTVLASKVNKQGKELFGKETHLIKSGLFDFDYKNTQDLRTKLSLLFDYTNAQAIASTDDPNRESNELVSNTSPIALIAALSDNGNALEYSQEYAKEVRCYFSKINGIAVGLIASNTSANQYFTPNGIDKIINFVNLLEAYELPLITLVNSRGMATTIEAEQDNAICYAGNLLNVIATSSIPKIGVAVGNAIGIAYTALLSKGIGFDYTLAFPSATISAINADTAVSLVYSEELQKKGNSEGLRAKLEDLYKKEHGSSFIAASKGFVDDIIHPAALRPYLANALLMLLGL